MITALTFRTVAGPRVVLYGLLNYPLLLRIANRSMLHFPVGSVRRLSSLKIRVMHITLFVEMSKSLVGFLLEIVSGFQNCF